MATTYDEMKVVRLKHLKRVLEAVLAEANKTEGRTEPVDLTEEYADEIAKFDNVWDWVQFRVVNLNTGDLIPGDWIPFTVNSKTYNAAILGINPYFGDYPIPHHIDFATEELFDTPQQWNITDTNNGDDVLPYPWLVSNLYSYLNTKLIDLLPETLQNVIIEKYHLIEGRYSDDGELTSPNGWGWYNIGKLWLPTEMEVFGECTKGSATYGGYGHQYPYYASGTAVNDDWYLLSPADNSSTDIVIATADDTVSTTAATTELAFPICFRVGIPV